MEARTEAIKTTILLIPPRRRRKSIGMKGLRIASHVRKLIHISGRMKDDRIWYGNSWHVCVVLLLFCTVVLFTCLAVVVSNASTEWRRLGAALLHCTLIIVIFLSRTHLLLFRSLRSRNDYCQWVHDVIAVKELKESQS